MKSSVKRVSAPTSAAPAPTMKEQPLESEAQVWRAATVLLVDEDLESLGLLSRSLDQGGYKRVKASNSVATLRALVRKYNPDLVILDIGGTDHSGLEVLTDLRGAPEGKDLGVITLCAGPDATVTACAIELGVADVVIKPVNMDELLLRVRNALTTRWLKTRLEERDALTGLFNRQVLRAKLQDALAAAQADSECCVLMHVDLDRFRNINETLGHQAGDVVLVNAARRLETSITNLNDTTVDLRKAIWQGVVVARESGNAFAVAIGGLDGQFAIQNAAQVAQRIHEAFSEPMRVNGEAVYQTVSTGIAVYPNDAPDPHALLSRAEAAMYQAKYNGRNGYEFFSAHMVTPNVHRLQIETEIRRVLEREELRVHYQPRVDLPSGRILGAEALVRWEHPERGLISPALFIPLADEIGLITNIGRWVMTQACEQARSWKEEGFGALEVSVNVSAAQLKNQRLWRDVKEVLRATRLDPGQLVLELTESMIMDDAEDSVRMLQEFRNLGIQCAIDDFGTGYSSLAYLMRFPLTEIKIDRSFVQRMSSEKQSQAIVSAMARELEVKVVAEGVETIEQLRFLHQRHCNQYQGYLCSRPLERRTPYYGMLVERNRHGSPHSLGTGGGLGIHCAENR